ncbi:hypothetical protein KKF05_02190 [Patescibacteria group bacterium]|nr:hypothetical protein [Patescibacteria group bacterium]MBU1029517.1 hypothetical protein [Patescibacteria group bacterium]
MASYLWLAESGEHDTSSPEVMGRLNDVRPLEDQPDPRPEYHPWFSAVRGADGVWREQNVAPLFCPGAVSGNWQVEEVEPSPADVESCWDGWETFGVSEPENDEDDGDGSDNGDVAEHPFPLLPTDEGLTSAAHRRNVYREETSIDLSWGAQSRARRQFARHFNRGRARIRISYHREIANDLAHLAFCEVLPRFVPSTHR